MLSSIFNASSLKQQSKDRHVPHSDTLSWFRDNLSALSPYYCVLYGEASNTNYLVFNLTRSWLGPTIYHTWGKRANHCTSNAVTQNEITFKSKLLILREYPTVSSSKLLCFYLKFNTIYQTATYYNLKNIWLLIT
jgi:hypothetical protein